MVEYSIKITSQAFDHLQEIRNYIECEMTEEEFQTMMDKGMQQVKNNESQDMDLVFNELMKGL